MRAYLTSCEERHEVCASTVADLKATDWAAPPTVVIDQARFERVQARVTDTGRRLLERAVAEADDLFLYLEDDLAFNRSLRWNLEHWAPVTERGPGDPFVASLYNPNVVLPATAEDPAPFVVADPRRVYGAQALVFSVTTARSVLEQWDEVPGMPDIRMPRLAARSSPVWYHRPSLVQHRPVGSTWGGAGHEAVDFSPSWRAVGDGPATWSDPRHRERSVES